jgi:hypothetical protein
MARMRIYTVHINPGKKHPYESPIFIEEAFNWAAFLFRPFWAFYHKLWIPAFVLLLLMVALEGMVGIGVLPLHIFTFINLGIMVYTGFQGNDWRREKLKRQGYIVSDIVTSDNLVGAEQRYFERYYPHGRLPQTPATHSLPA